MNYSLRSPTPKRGFQFSLKSLFVVMTITALSVGLLLWLRSQMTGNLQTIDIGTGPMKVLFFHCANSQDANELADHFDNKVFLASVRTSLAAEVKDTPIAFYTGTIDNGFFIKCDFSSSGNFVDKRNGDIGLAIDNAGRSYAASHSTVVKFEHIP